MDVSKQKIHEATTSTTNQRIQQLRERLELYNATISEAMGAVSNSGAGAKSEAQKSPSPSVSTSNTNNNNVTAATAGNSRDRPTNFTASKSAEQTGAAAGQGSSSPVRSTQQSNLKTGAKPHPGVGFSPNAKENEGARQVRLTSNDRPSLPNLERNLNKEFTSDKPQEPRRASVPVSVPSSKLPASNGSSGAEPSMKSTIPGGAARTTSQSQSATFSQGVPSPPKFFELPKEKSASPTNGQDTSLEFEVVEEGMEREERELSETSESEFEDIDDDEEEEEDEDEDEEDIDLKEMNKFLSAMMANDPFFRVALEEQMNSHEDVNLEDVIRRADVLHRRSNISSTTCTSEEEEEEEEEDEEEEEEEEKASLLPAASSQNIQNNSADKSGEDFKAVISSFRENSVLSEEATSTSEPAKVVSSAASPGGLPASVAAGEAGSSKENSPAKTVIPFSELETAHFYVCAALHGAEKVRGATMPLPHPLPLEDKLKELSLRRQQCMEREAELVQNPPKGPSVAEIKQDLGKKFSDSLHKLLEDCKESLQHFNTVEERQALVEGKERLLVQRQDDLQDRRSAVEAVKREIERKRVGLEARRARITAREESYKRLLAEHSGREKEVQAEITEVEALGKKVSSWLHILESREARVAEKEQRLQRFQSEVVRRGDEVHLFTQTYKKLKQPPPPPSKAIE